MEKMATLRNEPLVIIATWDDEGRGWRLTSDDVPGLALWAQSNDVIMRKLYAALPDLLEENGAPRPYGCIFEFRGRFPDIPSL